MSLDQLPSSLVTQLSKLLPNILGDRVSNILGKPRFFEVPKGGSILFRYVEGKPVVIRLSGKDYTSSSTTELLLMSAADHHSRFGGTISTPFFLIHPGILEQRKDRMGYKGVRIDETIRLGIESDPSTAQRLGLDTNRYISRYHMELKLLPDGSFILRDLGSTNGTFLNYRDTIGVNNEYFAQDGYIQENMRNIAENQFLSMLWPDLSQSMRQGPVGNCYFVAALNAIKEHPQGAELLSRMIQKDPQGYRVQFLGLDRYTIITDADLISMGNKKLSGSLGDNILERAYWRLRHDRYDPTLRGGFDHQITQSNSTLLPTNKKGKHVHEGGMMEDVLSDFLGPLIDKIRTYYGLCAQDYGSINLDNVGDSLITASTPSTQFISGLDAENKSYPYLKLFFPPDSQVYSDAKNFLRNVGGQPTEDSIYSWISLDITHGSLSGDRHSFSIMDINNVKQRFYFMHAYSVGHIDTVSGYIELINPHNTTKDRFYISIANFYKYFYSLNIATLNKL